MKHYYILEPYKGPKTRYQCPGCKKPQEFTRYINAQTGEYLADYVGRCNREINCGYHYTPKQYFADNPHLCSAAKNFSKQPDHFDTITTDLFKKTLKAYNRNNFVIGLIRLFGMSKAIEAIERYYIGTSKKWPGATIFWQIDVNRKIRAGKIMLYNPETLKRVKDESGSRISWIHTELKKQQKKEFTLKQCLFGEHLLRKEPKEKIVCIVESEKTAILASIVSPKHIWLATGGINLSANKFNVLKDRTVILYPDSNCFEKWSKWAKENSHITRFSVSDFLERITTPEQKEKGYDLADFILDKFSEKQNTEHTSFPNNHIPDNISIPDNPNTEHISFPIPAHNDKALATQVLQKPEVKKLFKAFDLEIESIGIKEKINDNKIEEWTTEIATLEKFYSRPEVQAIKSISAGILNIDDVKKFADNHLQIVKSNNGNPVYRPYLERLIQLKKAIEDQLLKLSL